MKNNELICWLIISGLVIASIGCLVGLSSASVEVSNLYEITGTGVVDRSLEIRTSSLTGEGQKFTESIHGSGFGVQSELNMTQSIDVLYGCNDSDISIYGAMTSTEARAKQYMRNYRLGAIHGCKLKGISQLEYEYVAENRTSMMHIEGESAGEMGFLIKLKDLETHKTIFCDEITITGYTKYNIESFVENASYPASGEEGDWLGCP